MSVYDILRDAYYYIIERKEKRYLEDLIRKGLKLGKNVNILNNVFLDPSHCFLISIGDNCTISDNVKILAHDASTKIYLDYTKIAPVVINHNCFIGAGTIILPGVTVGPSSIIGAGSVVTKDVAPETIVAGNPARVISSLNDYLDKIREISNGKKIFTDDYYIGKLDEKKMDEMIRSIGDTMGFIV